MNTDSGLRAKYARKATTPDDIYTAVLMAMQFAEEMGGPQGFAYIDLMQRISEEALARADAAIKIMETAAS